MFTEAELEDVARFFESRPDLTPTPLVHLPHLAGSLGLADILVKDESSRFGMKAFKIVGVAYAVDRLLAAGEKFLPIGEKAPPINGRALTLVSDTEGSTNKLHKVRTLACATEGNHGRAVARVARERGLRALVYMRRSAAAARVDAIRDEGAEIILVDGTYDDAVRRMAADAERAPGTTIVSDTAWPGYEAIPRAIMAGYTWIMTEAARQWAAQPPDVVVVQAGVGGLAGAVAGWLQTRAGTRPRLICAEPTGAACVRASIAEGHPVSLVPGDTIMAGLRCGEVSSIALPVLAAMVDECVTVDDEAVVAEMQRLREPGGGDPLIDAGASGACGLAALRKWIGGTPIAPGSRALVINTEGTTDPARYARGGA